MAFVSSASDVVQNPLGLLFQARNRAASSDEQGIGSEPEFLGDVLCRGTIDRGAAERRPRRRREFTAYPFDQNAKDMPIVFFVPRPTEAAVRQFQLLQHDLETGVAGRQWVLVAGTMRDGSTGLSLRQVFQAILRNLILRVELECSLE